MSVIPILNAYYAYYGLIDSIPVSQLIRFWLNRIESAGSSELNQYIPKFCFEDYVMFQILYFVDLIKLYFRIKYKLLRYNGKYSI